MKMLNNNNDNKYGGNFLSSFTSEAVLLNNKISEHLYCISGSCFYNIN